MLPVPLPTTQKPGDEGASVGSAALPNESWHITVADLSTLALPDDSDRTLVDPTYLLKHRSVRKGQSVDDASWDLIYAITTHTEDLETYEKLSWHVCIGDKGVSHKFREYFAVARTYQPGKTGPGYPREDGEAQPVDYAAQLARLSITNMELSAFEGGERRVICVFKDEQDRLEGLKKWFGLSGPFDGKL